MKRFRGGLSLRSLRLRITLTLVGLTVALGVLVLFYAYYDLTNILEKRVENQGIAIARDVAVESASLSPINDVFGLFELVSDSLLNNEDVRYIFIIEPSGDIRVHTFERGVPPGLTTANSLGPDQTESVRRLNTTEGPIIDIATPVFGWQGGVIRVGMTLANVRSQVMNHGVRQGLLIAWATLVGIGASLLLSSLLTRPLVRLAQAAKAVGRGNLSLKVPVDAADELGDLARSFNTMTDDLVRSRDDLMRRNTELSILNSMADHLSRRSAPEEIIHSSLHKLLEITGLSDGWVCLKGEDGRLALTRSRDGPLAPPQPGPDCTEGCVCHQVLHSGQGVVVQGAPDCPLLRGEVPKEPPAVSAIVPVSSQERVLGVLIVAAASPAQLGGAWIQLLRSVGQQIGVALENARLDREVRQKEEARGRLLDKLIDAQEEERKRIAREIHDEPTQTLTSIVMRLDQLERRLPASLETERQDLETAHREARTALEALHQIMVELRPHALDDLGFLPAIRWYAELRLSEQGIQLGVQTTGSPGRLDPRIETAVFRLMQEAINNIYKHSEAKHAIIRLDFSPAAIRGIIEDDGKGFDVTAVRSPSLNSQGLGLMGMEERASILGGSFTLTSRPGGGTRVDFEIPLTPEGVKHEQD